MRAYVTSNPANNPRMRFQLMPPCTQQTETSIDVDTDDKNQIHGFQHGTIITVDFVDKSKSKSDD